MPSSLIQAIIASLFISGLSLTGAILLFSKKQQEGRFLHYFISFAAGVMLSAAINNILPEAFAIVSVKIALESTLLGITIAFLMERLLLWHHHHHDETHHIKSSAYLVLFGDSLHNFIDGVALAATFLTSPHVGIATTIAIAAHEIPQELADFSVLIHAGLKNKRALFLNFLSGLTAIFGVLTGYYFLSSSRIYEGNLLGITGGIFIYIALADLIPELHSDHRNQKNLKLAVTFLVGVILMYLIANGIKE